MIKWSGFVRYVLIFDVIRISGFMHEGLKHTNKIELVARQTNTFIGNLFS